MYYKQVENGSIYYPKQIPYANNQNTFYTDSLHRKISDIEKSSKELFQSLEKRHNILEKKTSNLDASFSKSTRIMKKSYKELFDSLEKRHNLLEKKTSNLDASFSKSTRIIKKSYQELFESLEKRHNVLEKKTSNLDASFSKSTRILKRSYKELFDSLEKRSNLLDKKTNNLSVFVSESMRSQKTINHNLSNELKSIHENLTLFLELQNKYEAIIDAEVIPFIDQQASVNEDVLKQLEENRTIIFTELMPFITNIEQNLDRPIVNLLNRLSPGTSIQQITVQGAKLAVKSFIDYNVYTNISTFLLANHHILSVDSNKIDSLSFS